MANEIRIRANFMGGLVDDAPLTSTAVSLTSNALQALQVIGATQHMAIVLDPDGYGGNPEIAYITGHTTAAGTATILRGQEGTTARAHLQDTPWVHSATAADFLSSTLTAALGADVTISATSTYYDGPTLSVPVGTWLITGVLDYQGPTDWIVAKLWDGATVYGANGAYSPTAGGGTSLTIPMALVTLAAATTVKLSAATLSNTGGLIKAATHVVNTGTSGKVSRITALRMNV